MPGSRHSLAFAIKVMIDARAGGDLAKLAELRRVESVKVLDELKTWLWTRSKSSIDHRT